MIVADPFHDEERQFRRDYLVATCLATGISVLVFSLLPELDIRTAGLFRVCRNDHGAPDWCSIDSWLQSWRLAMMYLGFAAAAAVFVLAVRHWVVNKQVPIWVRRLQVAFVVLSLAVGPIVVANLIFKENWGRARPRDVMEFGGTKSFTSALVPTDQCRKNCSFVSGEASSSFMPFFAAALLVTRRRRAMIAVGFSLGLFTGLIRMAQGGHFISDVLFAAAFMALTANVIHALLFISFNNRHVWRWDHRGPRECATA